MHSKMITYKDYCHQDLELWEGFEWINDRRISRDVLSADSHRGLSWGLSSTLSCCTVASCTAWLTKCHSAAAPALFLSDSAGPQGPCSQHLDKLTVEQQWWHLKFHSWWHQSQPCFHVCGLVLTEPYVLMTHLPGSDSFLSCRWLESEIQIPSLPIYKKEESHETGI